MNREIEIKVYILNKDRAEKQILRAGGKFQAERRQLDSYWVPLGDDYFLRKPQVEYLRVRTEKGRSHLNYSVCRWGKDEVLESTDEWEVEIVDPGILELILSKIGFVRKVTVKKVRKYFTIGDFEVALDSVEELGEFLEIEAKKDMGGVEKTRGACVALLDSLSLEYTLCNELYPNLVLNSLGR
jgi:adenylate cyclase class 2